MASRGERIVAGRPSIRIVPASGWRMPNRVSSSSLRPAPTRPASARTSPLRTAKLTSRNSPARVRPMTAIASSVRTWLERGNCSASGRPTMAAMMSAWVMPATGRVRTWAPSRSTVTRSPSASTSSSRWEM